MTEAPDGSSAEGAWLELSVAADHEAVEAVSEILARHAPGGTVVEPAFEVVDEGLAARIDPSRPAVVRAYLPARDRLAAAAAVAAVERDLGHLRPFGLRPIGELETRLVFESDWAEAWKRHLPVLRVGRRLVVRPSWRRHRAAPGEVVVVIDPGMAFGTGLHPTTRLCLAALEKLADEGRLGGSGRPAGSGPLTGERRAIGRKPPARREPDRVRARVLDVGTGSGILAIAAAKLGAGEVLGLDPDPIAVEAATRNVRRNRLGRRIAIRRGTLPSGEGPFDVVVANLVAGLLVDLAPLLRAELAPGGVLVASGIVRGREDDVRRAFESSGLRVTERTSDAAEGEGDWLALVARPEGPAGVDADTA